MRTVKKNVYYCDHCKKRSLSSKAMNRHEQSCTANPDRYCRMCDLLNGGYALELRQVIDDLKKRFEVIGWHDGIFDIKWNGDQIAILEIKKIADDCPACCLSIMRQLHKDWKQFPLFQDYDFKKEMDNAMIAVNNNKPEINYYL